MSASYGPLCSALPHSHFCLYARIKYFFLRKWKCGLSFLHSTSGNGTEAKCRNVRCAVAIGGKADIEQAAHSKFDL
jgi:hypothetical protein